MLSKESRKDAIRNFKEVVPRVGTYGIRCTTTGRAWVGPSRNLDAARNQCWFCLRNGLHMEPSLQKEWNTHGESAFEFEVLECLDKDTHPLMVSDLLKQSLQGWSAQLSAQMLR